MMEVYARLLGVIAILAWLYWEWRDYTRGGDRWNT